MTLSLPAPLPVNLLQALLRFDTTNPPGNEAACIEYVRSLLRDAGIESQMLAQDEKRPSLVARIAGRGEAPPLLLYGHVDVVPTTGQPWRVPPFEGRIEDGYVWGRGALDMKGGVAMLVSAFLRAKAEGLSTPGDVVLCLVSDEEAGGFIGAKYLVDEHAALFRDIRYALGEFGGFSFHFGPKRFYPIMVAEKQICWTRLTVRGPGGHGSMPQRGGAMSKLSRVLWRLEHKRLPVHITPVAKLMIDGIAAELSGPLGLTVRQLANPALTDRLLDAAGAPARVFDPILHNTASPTLVRGGEKLNVHPSEIVVDLDGRLLPGFGPDDMLRELRAVVGKDAEVEIVFYDPGPPEPNMGLFETLTGVLRQADPEGVPIPFLLSGVSDARHFARLGIQTYGFLPMRLPRGFRFTELIHAADERIPVEALEFGTNAIYRVLQRFHA